MQEITTLINEINVKKSPLNIYTYYMYADYNPVTIAEAYGSTDATSAITLNGNYRFIFSATQSEDWVMEMKKQS